MMSILLRNRFSLFFALVILGLPAIAQAPRSYTSSEILLQLKKLNTVGAVLYIAAHPDDENTRLISYLANEKCLRTGYLSLTRGDGGQNLIGPEQGIELGVIRTQELLAARRIDGGEQFFTRAYDFGYSKTPEETFTKWNKDSILSDMVWVIRNFRPDIIITRFATDGSGGHGHHTASAILAEEAFDAAADPTRFPEQLKEVTVWKTRRMFHNSTARFFNPNADLSHLIKLDVGGYNPLLGKSYGEIAAESRSMHKSQGFGSAKQRGELFEYFKPIKGDTAGLKDIFEGIDFSWKRVKYFEKVGTSLAKVIKSFDVSAPDKSIKPLIKLKELIDDIYNKSPECCRNQEHYYYFSSILNKVIVNMSGLSLDVFTKNYHVSLMDTIDFTFSIVNRYPKPITLVNLRKKHESLIDFKTLTSFKNVPLDYNHQVSLPLKLHSGENPINNLYWLDNTIFNNRFNTQTIGFPERYYLPVNLEFSIDGRPIASTRNLQYKWVDPEKGELYRPVVITPPVMINVIDEVLTFTGSETKKLKVELTAGKDSVSGFINITHHKDWNVNFQDDSYESWVFTKGASMNDTVHQITSWPYSLNKKGERKTYTILIDSRKATQSVTLKPNVSYASEYYSKGIKEIKYDHIPIQTLFPEAKVKLVKLDVVKKSKRIGYIPGAGDEVQACLSQLGYEVITLTDEKLASENLSQYDAIVTGVRAYNTNEKLPTFKQKLMDYVANGGNLVVQYNTNSWAGPLSSDIGPYKFKITRNRITNEEAKVNFELPNHPVLNTPNKITDKDFEGWIQERSIYHAGELDSNFVTPISMADPNEKADKGALIIAKHGKGNFIYTGLVFFRELPAGVPGAYRLLVNLIELGK